MDSGTSSSEWWRPGDRARPETSAKVRVESGSAPAPGTALTLWALIGFTVILLLAPQERFPVLAPLRIALLSVAVAILACAYSRLSRRMPLIELGPEVIVILLFAFWAALTLPLSIWPGGSVETLTGPFFKAVVCFLLLSHAITDERQLRAICWCLVLCAVPLALTTLKNYLAGTYMDPGSDRVIGYSAGLTENPNDMALMLNLILPLCIALMLGVRSSVAKMMLAGTAVLIVAAVIATFSRAGFLTLVFIGICYAWLLRNRPQRVLLPIVLILGMFALPLVPSSYYERIDTIVNYQEDESNSAQSRLADMKTATVMAVSDPFIGSGIGMSLLALNEARGENWVDVHNVYLQIAVDLGFIGLLLYVLLLVRSLRVPGAILRKASERTSTRQMVFLAEALRISLLAFAVSAMFYPVAYSFYFYYFAGLAIAAGRVARDPAGAVRS